MTLQFLSSVTYDIWTAERTLIYFYLLEGLWNMIYIFFRSTIIHYIARFIVRIFL